MAAVTVSVSVAMPLAVAMLARAAAAVTAVTTTASGRGARGSRSSSSGGGSGGIAVSAVARCRAAAVRRVGIGLLRRGILLRMSSVGLGELRVRSRLALLVLLGTALFASTVGTCLRRWFFPASDGLGSGAVV
jgi:hypothetical protein